MPCTEAQKRANAAYNRRQDNIMLRPDKAEGAEIRARAAEKGQTLQQYLLEAYRAYSSGQRPQSAKGESYVLRLPRTEVDEIARQKGVEPAQLLREVAESVLG